MIVLRSIQFKVSSSGKVEVVPVKSSDGCIKAIVNKWGMEQYTEQLQIRLLATEQSINNC
ncbi:hypothetical protein [Microcoleus sp. FACHB-68]|uniref:hypothetical protein n=1 Tax=Microcoleus sp. FACHB-68 TaxID=2692826 RepID=UPI0016876AB3|nr:hypothetical protein [Microcoleus sp. FACHB-68]MBD1936716.1 hypothetical protein [Microcoleus sp. FACHB-68]